MPKHIQLHRIIAHALTTTTAAASLILSLPNASRAQSAQSVRDARRNEMETRQRALRDLEKLKRRLPAKSADKRPAYRDVAEDFEKLQLRNYNLSGAVIQGASLDYAQIREDAAEVKKRASRLEAHFLLPAPVKDQKQEKRKEILTLEGLKIAVASLDTLVNSFVWNPVFQRPGVVDVEQSAKARRDLDGIISLSEQIRRCADLLDKSTRKKF